MHPFHKLIATFSEDNHTRGKQFERLCKWILETEAEKRLDELGFVWKVKK